jgi:hypothetical protein
LLLAREIEGFAGFHGRRRIVPSRDLELSLRGRRETSLLAGAMLDAPRRGGLLLTRPSLRPELRVGSGEREDCQYNGAR